MSMNQRTLLIQTYRRILDLIITGKFSPRTRLAAFSLASQLGVSKTLVQEALLELEQKRVLSLTRQGDFIVKKVEEVRENLEVFVSSKMVELRDVREIVNTAIKDKGISAWVYEERAGARPEDVVTTSLKELERADVYVGLFGKKYGDVTVREYQLARSLGIPCFIYVRDRDVEREEELENFLKAEVYDLNKGVTYDYFDSALRLGEQVATDIMAWLVRRHREMTAEINAAHLSQSELSRLEAEVRRLKDIRKGLPEGTASDYLAQQMRGWFETLGYHFERHDIRDEYHFEWIINVPARRKYDRILVRGIEGEAEVDDITDLRKAVDEQKTAEGWLVAARRKSQAACVEVEKAENRDIFCYTFDELLDESADFSGYLKWLDSEVVHRGVDKMYVPLACTKDEFDVISKKRVGQSRYDEKNGWIDGYIDRWLDDPTKEHISILGEFGTGKTWFTLHYAWRALQRYQEAKEKGTERPRLPLIIPLRDYAKAVTVESLFSEFFFRKHEIPLPGYSAFEQLNRMGKLLLIFDGFDEMADRVDRQKMINNFWELAQVVVPGTKVVLTCRTEHFPEAREGRALLKAELKASTSNLTGNPPQFEVLELEKFDIPQVERVLSFRANPAAVQRVLENEDLLDLARRPIMTSYILEALPDIEAGKPVDLSRVYLYAVRRKMERDIKEERTFTSLADKLYFLCELSWEMLSTDSMSLNYRLFPERLRRLFGDTVQEQKELDHWHYDMMGQTMLIRNADGDYAPAHRSLLEFFVAYKFAAELGVLAVDFTELAMTRTQTSPGQAQDSGWFSYFQNKVDKDGNIKRLAPLREFSTEPLNVLVETLGRQQLTVAILDLMRNMLVADSSVVKSRLLEVINNTKNRGFDEMGFTGGNVATLLLCREPSALAGYDLSTADLTGINLYDPEQWLQGERPDLSKAKLYRANLQKADFGFANLAQADFKESNLTDSIFRIRPFDSASIHPISRQLVVSSPKDLLSWNLDSQTLQTRIEDPDGPSCVQHSPDGKYLLSSSKAGFKVRDSRKLEVISEHHISANNSRTKTNTDKDLCHVTSLTFTSDSRFLFVGNSNSNIHIWNFTQHREEGILSNHTDAIRSVAVSPDNVTLVSISSKELIVWNILERTVLLKKSWNNRFAGNAIFHPKDRTIATISPEGNIWLLDPTTYKRKFMIVADGASIVRFSPDGSVLCTGSRDGFMVFAYPSGGQLHTAPLRDLLKHELTVQSVSVEQICFDEAGKYAFVVTKGGVVVALDIKHSQFTDIIWHLPNVVGADFRLSAGLDHTLAAHLASHAALL